MRGCTPIHTHACTHACTHTPNAHIFALCCCTRRNRSPRNRSPRNRSPRNRSPRNRSRRSRQIPRSQLEEWFKHGGTLLGGMINPRDMRQHVNRVCIVFQCISVGLSMFTKLSLRAQCSNPLFLHDVFFIKMTCPWFHVIYQKSVFCQILLHSSTSSCQALAVGETRGSLSTIPWSING